MWSLRPRKLIQQAKQKLAQLVQSGHCVVSVGRLCSYADEAKLLYTRAIRLLNYAISHSSVELETLLEQGKLHLQRVAAYLQRLAAAHC